MRGDAVATRCACVWRVIGSGGGYYERPFRPPVFDGPRAPRTGIFCPFNLPAPNLLAREELGRVRWEHREAQEYCGSVDGVACACVRPHLPLFLRLAGPMALSNLGVDERDGGICRRALLGRVFQNTYSQCI
jgi:hypothetical protein